MVVSEYITCSICDNQYRLRVGVGFDQYQKHYFDCINCEQPIVFALRALAPNAHVETCENCVISTTNTNNIVLNFHPNCAFDEVDLHDPMAFPSLQYQRMIAPYMKMRPGKIQDVSSQFDVPNAPQLWNLVKSSLSTEKKGNTKSLKKLILSYNTQRNKVIPIESISTTSDMVNEFLRSFFYPRINDCVTPVLELIDELDKKSLLTDFIIYYHENLKDENFERYTSILTDYFRHRDHFGQLLYHARVYDEDVDDKIVGSKGFDHIKLYYGQVYESLTSNFTTLACLNNLASGRAYDTFEKMSLNKYIKDVDKSKKHNPFKSVAIFDLFHENLDSSLRNGSHHASIWRDEEQIFYRSGGTGAKNDIPYSKYLHMCNKLTISLAALFIIELHLQKKSK
ncbi:hypothetical protein [Shewanella colwelliana]|uniref:hypothetical protein n=1 Tax=Shewanella colwelliana TaxID=23 RepID=UPI003736D823